ncbi:kinesin heavy chain [Diplodia corticola]|uniref:Kinesin heavy chain n=1 Tax=Diplodia corticola TaxID=236234 RepID=A0A1J9R799_9PEZI|nr:kinesin heavy chain [Diplodia corticola]OJD36464.1 kinesin heavy chain [Diplodia corticola]
MESIANVFSFFNPSKPSRYQQHLAMMRSTSLNPDPGSRRNPAEELNKNHGGELGRIHNGEVDRNHDVKAGEGSALSLKQENRLLSKNNHLQEALWRAVSERATAEKTMRAMEEKISALEERNALLNSELDQVQGKLNSSIVDLRKAQLSSFKQTQTGWFVEEDSQVHHALTQLYKDVRYWAKAYAVKSLHLFRDFPGHLDTPTSNFLSRVATFNSYDDFVGFKHPFLILAALVSEVLSTFVFNDYFWMHNGESANVLRDTFYRLCSANATDARTWRALLSRAVFPHPVDSLKSRYNHLMHVIRRDIASMFIRQMGQDEDHRCSLELQQLIIRAMKLSHRLQTQRADYVWCPPSDLLGTRFDVRSPKLAADRLVKLEDEDDKSHNGKNIQLVVSPAVEKFGDSNGENLDTSRFLTKAVVFLDV